MNLIFGEAIADFPATELNLRRRELRPRAFSTTRCRLDKLSHNFFSKDLLRGLNLQEVALRFHLTEHFREKVPLALSVLKTVVAQPDFNNFEENGCHIISIPSASVIC